MKFNPFDDWDDQYECDHRRWREQEHAFADSDDDFDGITDDKDLCPQTIPGEAIDALGCGIDADLDGICDPGTSGPGCTGDDACPGFPNPDLQDAMGRTLSATPCPNPAPTPTMQHVDTMRLVDH